MVISSLLRFVQISYLVILLFILGASFAAYADDQPLNINTAAPSLLVERLPGIGPAKAKAIVSYREENGLFKTLDDLTDVKGIGPGILKKIRPLVFIDAADLDKSRVVGKAQTQQAKEIAARNAVRAAIQIAKKYEVNEARGRN